MQSFLHSNWKFFHPLKKRWFSAYVPGCVHLDLLAHKLIPDPFWGSNEHALNWIEKEDWKYALDFQVEADELGHDFVDLVADGLDTLATLRLNGSLVAKTENMFCGYRFPVKKFLKSGLNRLEITFASHHPYVATRKKKIDWTEWFDALGGSSTIRKEQCAFGWDWAPRLVSSGIFRPLGLQAWSGNRIESLQVRQHHSGKSVRLELKPELAFKAAKGDSFRCRLSLKGETVLETASLRFEVPHPELWWPNGLGAQTLYDLKVELWRDGKLVDVNRKRLGLRTMLLDRHKDRWGESFQFKVNGLPIFAKGANWIPAHSLLPAADRQVLEGLLTSAAQANMNMLRVWGGGVYESEEFYDLCDELGLLVWQDFMFSITSYPGDKAFLKLVEEEASYQVKRLAHRACLALWCGNNENEQWPERIVRTKKAKKGYEDLFYGVLPEAVKRHDGVTAYWPSSPHNPAGYELGTNIETAGDAHFWDVWHLRKPVKTYETKNFRFCSEFGMQSYSSPELAASFCDPEELNVFSPAMENHQKNAQGNQIILDYISRLYRFPKDYAALSYLSQLNQAYCMKVGVEHFRRSMPRTMGALYWQLNDCWPVFSWSSLEFGGAWKALHHAARRFFAPALVTAQLPGDETTDPSNNLISDIHEVRVFTVYDGREAKQARLQWRLWHLKQGLLKQGSQAVALRYGQSRQALVLDFGKEMARYGAGNLVLSLELSSQGEMLSRNTAFLTAPRFMNLPKVKTKLSAKKTGKGTFEAVFSSSAFQHQLAFSLPGLSHRESDNYFDLFPSKKQKITVKLEKDISLAQFKKQLKFFSLADTY